MALLLVVLAAACGGSATEADPGESGAAPEDGAAMELGDVPAGYQLDSIDQWSSSGRRIGYRSIDPGPYGDDGWQIQVTAMVPSPDWNIDRMRALYRQAEESGDVDELYADVDLDAEVRGHEAIVGPATDDGRQYGYEVFWEESPGLMVHVEDVRRDGRGTHLATQQSVLDLAEQVRPLTRSEWDAALAAYEVTDEYAGPPEGAVETVVARGDLDGDVWQLSVLAEPEGQTGYSTCLRLSYAGEDTGPGCAVIRVVLGGHGFVVGWAGASASTMVIEAGPGSEFETFSADVRPYGDGPVQFVYVVALPDGACAVDVHRDEPGRGGPYYQYLLPGDPGALECAGR